MTTTAVTHKWIQLSHGRTRYIDAGTGAPPLLLHISSIEGGADDYLVSLDHLVSQYRVIVPDLIGWPPSDTIDGIDAFPRIVDFLREFQDALRIERWHVVGVSMGGWIAGLFAYESPDRCDKVVIGGHPFTGAPNRRMIDFTPEMITSDEGVRAWIESVTRGQGVDTEALVQEKLAKIHEPGFAEAFAKIMRTMGSPANREHYALIRRLPRMRLPVLILIGERDEAAMALKDQVMVAAKTAELKVVPSGHRMHIEDTAVFAQAVRNYIER
jgi:pimeloyl-ACP methyl ester carboxylesterase